jgi:hypothetical protein
METITKEYGVVMLDTRDFSNISKAYLANPTYLRYSSSGFKDDSYASNDNQHIYFTSDDEIKEGDWVYSLDIKGVFTFKKGFMIDQPINCKKIIATTDTKLNDRYFPSKHNVPNIPQSFVESYAKNPVDKVELEHEEYLRAGDLAINPFTELPDTIQGILEDKDCVFFNNSNTPYNIKSVKLVNPKLKLINNEVVVVNIKPKLYTKEEVEVLIRKCRKDTYNGYSMNKWIKENLK